MSRRSGRAPNEDAPTRSVFGAAEEDPTGDFVDRPAADGPETGPRSGPRSGPRTGVMTGDAQGADTDAPEPEPGARGRRRRASARSGPVLRPRAAVVVAGLLAAAAAGWALWTVPATRDVLLDSFTERPRTYAELFFTATPGFEGSTVVVPIAVTDHGEGAGGYQVRVTLESPSGQVLATSTTALTPRYGAPVPLVAKLQTTADVALVRVALVDHPQSLYFRFGKSQTPHG